jgi:hypothetical protein
LNSNVSVLPLRPAAVPGSLTYPANRLGWLHKFSSLLVRAEVAREIGRDAMLLILAIAVREDALQYGSATIFFDSELQRLIGIRSRQHLDRIRQKAVDAGWLVVVRSPDGDQTVAQYWTLIPKRLNVFQGQVNVPEASEAAEVQHRPEACGIEVDAEQSGAHQACIVPGGEAPGEPGPIASPCPWEASEPCVGPPADAELEARLGSAGASPSRSSDNVGLNTPIVGPATQEPARNRPAVAELATAHSEQSITVVSQAAVVAAPPPGKSTVAPTVPKRLNEYSPHIREQAGVLLAAYPSRRDLNKGLPSICRALEKIPYFKLRPLINLYIVARNRPGQDPKLTPSAATWFDEERWQEESRRWELRDRDFLS